MRNNFLETIIGAIVLFVAGVFFAFGYQFSGRSKVPTINIKASFSRADGVVSGSDVRIGGVSVGNVSAMEINKDTFKACLTLEIDANIKLPADTSAEVVSESLMGGKYINLTPGNDSELLKNGGKIDITQSSISFESMLSKYIFTQGESASKK